MLPLINVNERIDLVISVDLAIHEPTEGRHPCRAIPKSECTINGGTPLVLTVRPLRSREMTRVMSAASVSLSEAALRACEIALTAVSGEDDQGNPFTIADVNKIEETIDAVPHYALLATGSYLIEKNTLPADPSVPDA